MGKISDLLMSSMAVLLLIFLAGLSKVEILLLKLLRKTERAREAQRELDSFWEEI